MSVGSDTKAVRARAQDDASLCASHADLTTRGSKKLKYWLGGAYSSCGLTALRSCRKISNREPLTPIIGQFSELC
jgi:hypothetical protein